MLAILQYLISALLTLVASLMRPVLWEAKENPPASSLDKSRRGAEKDHTVALYCITYYLGKTTVYAADAHHAITYVGTLTSRRP